ncbi:STAS domain-containing protein [Nonomuraea zeae]|uniref:STAS domain-containing protein n=1 Tax=Nonomuraea zeae TaxID=1642303 RepID=UPI001478B29C|nr:STAS domain-containing protein [Nonomuraea zeae]
MIALNGSLDEATVADVEREIRLLNLPESRLIVEVSDLHFLDDYGVDVLVLLAHHMRQHGGLMALVDTCGHVRRALGDSGLDDLLPLFATMAEAMRSLNDGDGDGDSDGGDDDGEGDG